MELAIVTAPLRLGLVGLGKIAVDQHIPAIDANPKLELVAVATLAGEAAGIPSYASVGEMLAAHPAIDAVVMSQPPSARYAASKAAIEAGRHVFLEKPPGVTPEEVRALQKMAKSTGVSLFTAWHSRWSDDVDDLRNWCLDRPMRRVRIEWKEDVRLWHAGQEWIWQEGGFGVFDPGINALSILTKILPGAVRVISALLEVPVNCHTPIAARVVLETEEGTPVQAEFDWRQTGPQVWKIEFQAQDGEERIYCPGQADAAEEISVDAFLTGEYGRMYAHFIDLIGRGASDIDVSPLEVVADACRRGRLVEAAPFSW